MKENIRKIFSWINGHIGALAILGGVFWSFVTAIWVAFALPVIDSHIDSRVMALAKDSLGDLVDEHLKGNGGGFRGQLADTTGIPKHKIVSVLGELILEEDGLSTKLTKLENELDYQRGYNFWILKQVANKSTYNGVVFWTPPDGNVYYRDVYQYLWDAKYDNYDDCYYYYPNYANGNRLKCD
jgi:hypothetical protein